MKSQIRKMGNSHGIIIPKPLLDEIGVKAGDPVELKINKKGRLVIAPIREKPRAGWAKDSRALAEAGEGGTAWPESAAPAGKGPAW